MIAGVPAIEVILSPCVVIIIIASAISIGTLLDRTIYFFQLKLNLSEFIKELRKQIEKNAISKAIELCDKHKRHPVARFAKDVLGVVNLPRVQIISTIEKAGIENIREAQSHIGVLSIVSFVGPLLGLFGTVVGIVQAFASLAEAGGGSPTEMMGGIAIALVTTAVGIAVAVPAAIGYGIFGTKVDEIERWMKRTGKSLIRSLSFAKLIDTSIVQKVRKKLEEKEKFDPSENSEALTPGINMALLIICFFMIFVPNMYQSHFTVSTPALKKSKEDKKEEQKKTELKLNIYLGCEGEVYINNELMPPDTGVQNELMRQLLLRSLKRLCVISACEDLYHYQVVDIMDRARQAGAERICLLKRKRAL
jgi:biopolymer transport protein ExbB